MGGERNDSSPPGERKLARETWQHRHLCPRVSTFQHCRHFQPRPGRDAGAPRVDYHFLSSPGLNHNLEVTVKKIRA
jgi:hypothetical protein